ncbi:hypothetical protein A2954_00390 [Candidatus Roizmanbacteria bacterium RIFCSPLOWO2_01_FULL_37_12]|uniref:phenylalanine--tRNA ligase n=1 Tax=Candidatus Roizmanbacteria bacterium RIFCSPLOWO2_01_FULL_37_12 TaxID=1802056 RepID=A0A1F7IB89_9BACT|nr:MAG: hypothetical protein A2768_00395 [Candidatus Roizmanbacteria bacterium RIFCSPHIGHO2_01_FULL_37_16]OGK40618.1 MAG: hypothetical protein A2954_00390 [Candidatus Roizmanbacteria bacterium RIFCSPLOWO2_01_FULL_37_12]
MNIKITHSWLLEYLDTDSAPDEIQKYLSLCGPSVERIEKIKDDYVYDIEITSNRVDSASVMGIAREATTILPRYGKKAQLKNRKIEAPKLVYNTFNLTVEDKQNLSRRTMAVIFDGVKIKQSPSFIKERLEAIGIRSLNNLVDITNYIMVETGHPTHVFDYDRVKTGRFIFRLASKGEKLITLDKKIFTLKGGEIVIDDGTGRIIDLPSIMGTENSVVTSDSKRVIFFIDNVDPVLIRKASMTHGIRTIAATYNEKGIDPEIAKTTLLRGIQLFQANANPSSMSRIVDIYKDPVRSKAVKTDLDFINSRIGVKIPARQIILILKNLQFGYEQSGKIITVIPPSYRAKDIQIPEDIVEEVARIYGYHNLPNNIQSTVYVKQPKDMELFFELQSKIKHFLKHLGLNEVMNYSMVSKDLISKADLKPEDHLRLKNTISGDIEYLRTHLLPSLIVNIKNNEGKGNELRFFEIAKVYLKMSGDLPFEPYKLGIATNTSLADLKGIITALLNELNIHNYDYAENPKTQEYSGKLPHTQSLINIESDNLVKFGFLSKERKLKYELKSDVFLAVFNIKNLIKFSKSFSQYIPINQYAVIKLDKTFQLMPYFSYAVIRRHAYQSKLLQKLEVISLYKNNLTLRFYYSSLERNITEKEAKNELEKIKEV